MQATANRDLIVGLFVFAGLCAIAFLSVRVGGVSLFNAGGLHVHAVFDQIGGLKPRAPVQISGVRVGQVTAIRLDGSYRARVEMDIDARLELPIDTSASIVTSGLLGDRYVSLEIGAEDELLRSGDEISFTESAVILERLIGQVIHGARVGDD